MLLLEAGEERAVAATKTYMNSLGAIAMLFAAVDGPVAETELQQMPELLERQIAMSFDTAPSLAEYAEAVGATVVARGVNYGTAFEIALKIRELSGLVVEAYSPADLMHGPIAAIREGWPVIVVAPSGPARPSVEDLVLPLRERGARIVAVSDVARRSPPSADEAPARPSCAGVAEPAHRGDPGPADRAPPRGAARPRSRQPAPAWRRSP